MTYQEFKETICVMMKKRLDGQADVTVQDIIKNNNTHLDGLMIVSHQSNLSPTIYLDYYFNRFQNGVSLSCICEEILCAYRAHSIPHDIDISFFTDYSKVKSRIVFKLINYEKNRELLSKVPHYRFLDLAVVFCCLLEVSGTGNATILIYTHHLALWDITADDLYALAAVNTPKLLHYDMRNMTDVLKELWTEGNSAADDPLSLHELCPMYVLTNKSKLNGSACILYQNLLKDFAHRIGSDLYILPSSVHEVLLLPARIASSCEELTRMVQEVNETELSSEEVLSDHVYYFSRETGQITM